MHIVLFEPEIPQNVGNIARTCAAIQATLHLVHPLGFSLDDRYLKRASLDYWHLVTVIEHPSVEAFFASHQEEPLWFFSAKAKICYSDVTYRDEAYLIFGRESTGIDTKILAKYPKQCLRIPMVQGARSLNVSNCVAIAAYEAMRQHAFPGLAMQGTLHSATRL